MTRYEIALNKTPPEPKTIAEILGHYGFSNVIENPDHTFSMTRYNQRYMHFQLENPEDIILLSESTNKWNLMKRP